MEVAFLMSYSMMNVQTAEFIQLHIHDDVARLALQGPHDAAVDLPFALNQIAGRQTARKKLPAWAEVEGILYPPHLSMEQCSSEPTARYKAELAADCMALLVNSYAQSSTLVDLTGGFGVDFSYMARVFQKAVYVERQASLCELAQHNFAALQLQAKVVNADAEVYLQQMDEVTMAFMDPARRDHQGGRTYGIADCTPNVLEMLPTLLNKAQFVLLKLSPMLDWQKAVRDINQTIDTDGMAVMAGVKEVHIIAVGNECKELLVLVGRQAKEPLKVVCRNDASVFVYTPSIITCPTDLISSSEDQSLSGVTSQSTIPLQPGSWLLVPHAALMKAGCFAELEARYGVRQLAVNSHLMVSAAHIDDFPGRQFVVNAVCTMNKKELRDTLRGIKQANVAVRNFPMSVDALRKRLKIKEGGSVYIFATTLADQKRVLLVCSK